MNYLFHIVTLASIYVLLAQSLNVTLGYGGLVSLCQAAFSGIGAYMTALLMLDAGWPFFPSVLLAVAMTSVTAWLIAGVLQNLSGDFLLLGTLAFQGLVYEILRHWEPVTRGDYGVNGVPRPSLLGMSISSPAAFALFAVVVALVCCLLLRRLLISPFGRTLQAIRDDPVAAAALRKDCTAFRQVAFAWSGSLAAVGGVLFATNFSYIDPSSFGLEQSILILCVLVVGGAGNLRGAVIGAIVLALLPELLRLLQLPDAFAAVLRQILYGLALITMVRFRPQGLAGRYTFRS